MKLQGVFFSIQKSRCKIPLYVKFVKHVSKKFDKKPCGDVLP